MLALTNCTMPAALPANPLVLCSAVGSKDPSAVVVQRRRVMVTAGTQQKAGSRRHYRSILFQHSHS